MKEAPITIIFDIQSEKLFNVSTRGLHQNGQPLPEIGDTVHLQPDVEHSGDFTVASRKFHYNPAGGLEAIELVVR